MTHEMHTNTCMQRALTRSTIYTYSIHYSLPTMKSPQVSNATNDAYQNKTRCSTTSITHTNTNTHIIHWNEHIWIVFTFFPLEIDFHRQITIAVKIICFGYLFSAALFNTSWINDDYQNLVWCRSRFLLLHC